MAHSLDGITIHVDDGGLVEVTEANYTFQEVLDATSDVISFYGAKSDRLSVSFVLDEDENSNAGKSTLKSATKTNASVNLTLDTGSLGNVRILSLRTTRQQALNHTHPVYKADAELVEVP